MKKLVQLGLILLLVGCKSGEATFSKENYEKARVIFSKTIDDQQMKTMLYKYASDEFEGRMTGELGQKKAVNYIADFYKSNKITTAPNMKGSYFQTVPMQYINGKDKLVNGDSENVLAYIEGAEFPEEVVVVSAHLDHIGKEGDKIFNGADDDGSGTIAIMNIAQSMQAAANKGFRPRRSILFLHVTGEELGLWGSKYYSEHPVIPMKNTVADLNIDMIGRVDDKHMDSENYIYPIGSDMLSNDLHQVLLDVNSSNQNLELDFTYNSKDDPNRFYYRSDHYNFAKNDVPVIFFFNGTHDDYHQETDTPEKINYPLLQKRTQLIFNVLWELANADERVKLK